MMKAIVALFLLVMSLPALAMDVAKDPGVVVDGVVLHQDDVINRGDVALLALLDGAFTDLTEAYAAALGFAGMVPDIYYDPAGGVNYGAYNLLFVTCADNWWFSMNYPLEIEAWRTYMDQGGRIVLIGQDFLDGSGDHSFVRDYCGMTGATEDVIAGDSSMMTWIGTDVLAGISGSMQPCYAANAWYTDDISGVQGLCRWSTVEHPGSFGGGCASMVGVFSVVEFACEAGVDGSLDAVGRILGQLFPVANEASCLSSVKRLY